VSTPASTGVETAPQQRFWLALEGFLAELGGAHAARRLSLDASLERDLGLGSLERVELLSRLEREFGVLLPDAAMAEADTVSDVWRALAASHGSTAAQHLSVAIEAPPEAAAVPESAANLLQALWFHARAHPDRPHVYLRAEDQTEQTLTYGQVAARACQVAAELSRRGIGAGDRVALILPTGEDFFFWFLGILLAQAVPVPLYPPFRADRIEEYAARQAGILNNAEALLLITWRQAEGLARLLRPRVPSLSDVVSADRLHSEGPASWPALPSGGDAPALIQYTSGSTGDPKGVLLTHANLLANIRAVGQAIEVSPGDSAVSWLPLYHDMGLIGAWLLCLYHGIPITILSPLAFLSRPERWLWAIHDHRATLSIGPNFAYDLCARKIPDEALEGLDLTCWRAAFNGSESVRPETLDRFAARFARYGFRPEVVLPIYGLAESTVGLCFPPLHRGPLVDRVDREAFEGSGRAEPAREGRAALAFVSVGPPLPGHEVRLVDEQGGEVADRVQARLEFRGPSVMAGYFRRPEATAAIRHGDWLDSGDLAYRVSGELFITGRSKDIILKAGRNLYPHEIEAAAEDVDGVRRGCVAAFGVSDPAQGTEKLVVVAETRLTDPAARERVRLAIVEVVLDLLGLPPDEVVLLAPGRIPKTSSGKLRRGACRQMYEQGRLDRRRASAFAQWLRLAASSLPGRWRQAAGRAGRLAYAGYAIALFVPLALACWVVLLLTPSGPRAASVERAFIRLFFRLAGIRIDVEGVENLPSDPLVLVSNHASYLDPLILIAALPRPVLFVAKQEVLRAPVVATWIRKPGHLTVERGPVAQSARDTARLEEALARGRSVSLFAEGTFTRARGLRPFRLGAFKAAAQAGCPIVPAAIVGSRTLLPDETWLPRRTRLRIVLRPAMRPQGDSWQEMIRLRDAAFAEILAHCGEPRLAVVSAAVPKSARS